MHAGFRGAVATASVVPSRQYKILNGISWRPARPSRVATRDGLTEDGLHFNIHGRHVEVTPELEEYVKSKLTPTLQKLQGPEYLEGEGHVDVVDVRLMNVKAGIRLQPVYMDKAVHDTYLRMGELRAERYGVDARDAFDNAAAALERKLHRWRRASPRKKDMRFIGKHMGKSSAPHP